MFRIGIDARMYGPTFTGIGIYTARLLRELVQLSPPEIVFVVFADEIHRAEITALGGSIEFISIKAPHYSISEQVLFLRILKNARLNLMHFVHFNAPLFYSGKSVVTIHDLILSFYPGKSLRSWIRDFAYRITLKSIVTRANSIITVSRHTKKDLIELMQIDDKHIFFIHNGVDDEFAKQTSTGEIAEMRRILQISSTRYMFYLGILQDHKNIVRLIQAFGIMIKSGFDGNLILAGKEDTRYTEPRDMVRELGLQSRVQFLGHVENFDRVLLMKEASLFVMPSLYEGFGTPILEAMKAGTPVICSNSSSLPEIAGEAARYFHPLRPETLAKVALEILESKEIQSNMSLLGLSQAAKFSWGNMAKETLAVYMKALKN